MSRQLCHHHGTMAAPAATATVVPLHGGIVRDMPWSDPRLLTGCDSGRNTDLMSLLSPQSPEEVNILSSDWGNLLCKSNVVAPSELLFAWECSQVAYSL